MRKILVSIALVVLLTGCTKEEVELLESKFLELESELLERSNKVNYLEETLQSEVENSANLEVEIDTLTNELYIRDKAIKDQEEKILEQEYFLSMLPTYMIEEMEQYHHFRYLPKPENTYLLIEEDWIVNDYRVFTAEEGGCEASISWTVYNASSNRYTFATNAGCNPEWIHWSTPLYLDIDGNLVTIEDAIKWGYITEQDLIESGRFKVEEE